MDNIAVKLPGYATALGVTPAEVASVQADAAMFNYIMDMQEAYKTFKQNVSDYKNVLRDGPLGAPLGAVPVFPTLPVAPAAVSAGVFARIRKLAGRIKTIWLIPKASAKTSASSAMSRSLTSPTSSRYSTTVWMATVRLFSGPRARLIPLTSMWTAGTAWDSFIWPTIHSRIIWIHSRCRPE